MAILNRTKQEDYKESVFESIISLHSGYWLSVEYLESLLQKARELVHIFEKLQSNFDTLKLNKRKNIFKKDPNLRSEAESLLSAQDKFEIKYTEFYKYTPEAFQQERRNHSINLEDELATLLRIEPPEENWTNLKNAVAANNWAASACYQKSTAERPGPTAQGVPEATRTYFVGFFHEIFEFLESVENLKSSEDTLKDVEENATYAAGSDLITKYNNFTSPTIQQLQDW